LERTKKRKTRSTIFQKIKKRDEEEDAAKGTAKIVPGSAATGLASGRERREEVEEVLPAPKRQKISKCRYMEKEH